MENSFITAPQIIRTDLIFNIWKSDHVGTMDMFLSFMSTPSVERDRFLVSLSSNGAVISETFEGSILSVVATVPVLTPIA